MRGTDFMVGGKTLREMTADHLMQSNPTTCRAEDTAYMAADAALKMQAGAVSVVDREGKLVGIVTEFDLLRLLAKGKDLEEVAVAELMTTHPVTVSEKTPATEILDILQTGHLLHLPVVDAGGRVIGMIERSDVLAGYMESKLGPFPVPF